MRSWASFAPIDSTFIKNRVAAFPRNVLANFPEWKILSCPSLVFKYEKGWSCKGMAFTFDSEDSHTYHEKACKGSIVWTQARVNLGFHLGNNGAVFFIKLPTGLGFIL